MTGKKQTFRLWLPDGPRFVPADPIIPGDHWCCLENFGCETCPHPRIDRITKCGWEPVENRLPLEV